MQYQDLVEAASLSRASDFAVGAALLIKSGKTLIGCNVENISFGLPICAERAAVAGQSLQAKEIS